MTIETPSLESVMKMWAEDSKIDISDPSGEIIRTPVIHSKYNTFLSLHNLSAKKYSGELNLLRKLKWQYYSGKMDETELNNYGWEPFRFTLKSDINVYLDGDEDLIKLKRKQAYHEEAASFITNVMKELNSRTYQLKEYMTHERFMNGAR